VLVGDSLRWDVEIGCAGCGFAVADCGGELPDDVRELLLAEHGRALLRVQGPVRTSEVMRALRGALGVGLTQAKVLSGRVVAGEYGGTRPEVELVARRLRAAGMDAVVEGP
jgi:hypothetical protein